MKIYKPHEVMGWSGRPPEGDEVLRGIICGKFHSHITVSSVDRDKLMAFCHGRGMKPTIITDERGNETRLSMMTTMYHVDTDPGAVHRIIASLEARADDMRAAGFEVLRVKLEYGGHCPDGFCFSKGLYHEVHVKLSMPSEAERYYKPVVARALEGLPFFMSSSGISGHRLIFFVSTRMYSGSMDMADVTVTKMLRAVTASGGGEVDIVEVKREVSVYDTNQALDDWFLPCSMCQGCNNGSR